MGTDKGSLHPMMSHTYSVSNSDRWHPSHNLAWPLSLTARSQSCSTVLASSIGISSDLQSVLSCIQYTVQF